MCAISGYISNKYHLDENLIIQVSNDMSNRGPDSSGTWTSDVYNITLSHQRLSILDNSICGSQPMHSHNEQFVLIFNGEIYNFKEIKDELIKRGVSFRGNSDTEVILECFNLYRESSFEKFRGMFSIAIYDKEINTLFLARDTFGIKPLYYYFNDNYLIFSSQIKSLNKFLKKKISINGLSSFILWGHVTEPNTIYEDIHTVQPGYYLTYKNGQIKSNKFFDISDLYIKESSSSVLSIKDSLSDSLNHHLIADHPVSLMLSSGIDSTALLSLAAESGYKLDSFTLSFSDFNNSHLDESSQIKRLISYYGTNHTNIVINRNFFDSVCDEYFNSMDQPTIDGLNIWLISKAIKENGYKVTLSGLGADEILFGYPSFKQIKFLSSFVNKFPKLPEKFKINLDIIDFFTKHYNNKISDIFLFNKNISSLYYLVRGQFSSRELRIVISKINEIFGYKYLDLDYVYEILNSDLSNINDTCETINSKLGLNFAVSFLETNFYMKNRLLRDSDWASMHSSIELRVPFVDKNFYRNFINNKSYHQIVRKRDFFFNDKFKIPKFILNRKKTGFEIPSSTWSNQIQNLKIERAISNIKKFI